MTSASAMGVTGVGPAGAGPGDAGPGDAGPGGVGPDGVGPGGVGMAVLPEGDRVDFGRLRAERRRRLLDAMASHDLDALILGRPANVVYASGARQLWTAGARPFAPACIVVRGTGRVHLLSTWDEGVPADIAREDLFGLSWNPARVLQNVGAVPGLAGARRVGTDGFGVGTPRLVAGVAPGADVADAGPALAAARSHKTVEELACIVTALALAEGALAAMSAALVPGIAERELIGVHGAALAAAGAPTPASEAVACTLPGQGPVRLRRMAGDRRIGAGELVALSAGALYGGYEGPVARTRVCGTGPGTAAQSRLVDRARDATEAVVAACRPGSTGADLLRAWRDTGETPPPEPVAWGIGLGVEPPVVAPGGGDAPEVGAGAVLGEGMVLAVQGWVAEEGTGGALQQDVVLVTASGPRVLSRA